MPARKEVTNRSAGLAQQGQTWSGIDRAIKFKRPRPMLQHPLEISIRMLRGIRMVDETVVVVGSSQNLSARKSTR